MTDNLFGSVRVTSAASLSIGGGNGGEPGTPMGTRPNVASSEDIVNEVKLLQVPLKESGIFNLIVSP
jgi:hypothetical protein